jgi:hypothetical protein
MNWEELLNGCERGCFADKRMETGTSPGRQHRCCSLQLALRSDLTLLSLISSHSVTVAAENGFWDDYINFIRQSMHMP